MILRYPDPLFQAQIIGLLRIVVGLLLIYHGQEVFHPDVMSVYKSWEVFSGQNGALLAYFGKTLELLSGLLLFFGLFTRIGALLCIGTLSFVTFVVGHGKVWYGDQHPFMFVLFGLLFFFSGPGKWSLDGLREKENN